MDDIERAIDDGVNTVKCLTRVSFSLKPTTRQFFVQDNRFLPGAGAVEVELAKQITSYGEVRDEELVSILEDEPLFSLALAWLNILSRSLLKLLRLFLGFWLRMLESRLVGQRFRITSKVMGLLG